MFDIIRKIEWSVVGNQPRVHGLSCQRSDTVLRPPGNHQLLNRQYWMHIWQPLPASYLLTSNMSTEIRCKKFKGHNVVIGTHISEGGEVIGLILWVFIVLMWQWILLGCGAGHNVFIVCCGFLLQCRLIFVNSTHCMLPVKITKHLDTLIEEKCSYHP